MNFGHYKMMKKIFLSRKFPSLYDIGKNFIKYNYLQPLCRKPFLPLAMTLYVTYRCNMRCRMCGIWKLDSKYKSNELSLKELNQIFSDRLFSKLEFININGGEPNLREDLIEIGELLVKNFPRLKEISLNSNGLPPEKTLKNVERLSHICQTNNIRFSMSVSLHKIGEEYDKIAGVKNAYYKVKQTLDGLKKINHNKRFYISANCVITNLNLFGLEKMLNWSKREQIPVNFVLGEVRDRFHNKELSDEIEIKENDKKYLIKFFRSLADSKKTFFQHSLRYSHLADMIQYHKNRTLSCHYEMGGLVLGSDGLLYYCKNSREIGNCKEKSAYDIYFHKDNLRYKEKIIKQNRCNNCPPYTLNKMEAEKDLFKIIKFLFIDKRIKRSIY